MPTVDEWLTRAQFDPASYDLETLYYEGQVRMAALGWSVPPGMEVLQTVVNWCALGTDALRDRLKIGSFRVRGAQKPSAELGNIWVDAGMPAESQVAILEALVHKRGYLSISTHPTDTGRLVIRAESRRDLWAERDRATGDVLHAVRHIQPVKTGDDELVTIYEQDSTSFWWKGPDGIWYQYQDPIEHGLGMPTVVPLVHGPTVWNRHGKTRMRDVASLTDACCRTLTNLGAAQELMATPARWVFGAKKGDFTDPETGKQIPKWQAYLGRLMMLSDPEAKAGQWSAADLRNFVEVVNLYSKLVSSMTGLPPEYLGYSDANPASAEGIYASRERLITSAEAEQIPMGDAFERSMRIGVQLLGDKDPGPIEGVWDDAATPTIASKADAGVKLYTAGIVPREAVWDLLGYDQEVQARYAKIMAEREDMDPTERTARMVAAATGAKPASERGGQPEAAAK